MTLISDTHKVMATGKNWIADVRICRCRNR